MPEPPRELTRTLLGVLCIGVLIVAAFWIVRPFLAAAIWAITIVVLTWPMLLHMQRWLWNSRGAAVATMLVILLLLFVIPLTLAVGTIAVHAGEIAERARSLAGTPIPSQPEWLAALPIVGATLATAWADATASGVEGLGPLLVPYAGGLAAWFVASAGNLGYLTVQILLTLVLAAFMYANGEEAASIALRFARRLGGKHGEDLMQLAGRAISGVALGVVFTAAIQSVLGGIGLAAAGVPFAGLLTAVLLIVCVAQVGMLVVMLPAVAWLYWNGEPVWGTFLLLWSVVASVLDQFLRPVLVRRSAHLPLLLVFVGVIGGLVAFGPLGIFVGPVVLAVAYTLLMTWLQQDPLAATP